MCCGIQSKEQPRFFGQAGRPQHVQIQASPSQFSTCMWESIRSLIPQQLGSPSRAGEPLRGQPRASSPAGARKGRPAGPSFEVLRNHFSEPHPVGTFHPFEVRRQLRALTIALLPGQLTSLISPLLPTH